MRWLGVVRDPGPLLVCWVEGDFVLRELRVKLSTPPNEFWAAPAPAGMQVSLGWAIDTAKLGLVIADSCFMYMCAGAANITD